MQSMSKQKELNSLFLDNEFSGIITIKKESNYHYKNRGGFRDIPNELPINIETKFGIASGTKLFTALGILKLQETGKLHINDSISSYVEGVFPKYDSSITIKHLLTHTSGIPDYLDEENPSDMSHMNNYHLLKPQDYLKFFPQTHMEFTPGEKFKYNNGGFILLAHIIELVTGDYHKYIEDMIYGVGLSNTGFYKLDALPKNTANGYVHLDDNTYKTNIFDIPIIGGGDGGIFTTESDIHLLWNELFKFNIISKDTLSELMIPHTKTRKAFYGLGVWLTKNKDTFNLEIFGEDAGVSFYSKYDPTSKVSIVVISNNDEDAWKAFDIFNKEES